MSGFTKDFEKDDGAVWDLVLRIKTKLFRKLSWNIFPLSQNSSAITTLLLQICKTNQSKLKTNGFQKCLKQTVFYTTRNIFMQMFAKDVYLFI